MSASSNKYGSGWRRDFGARQGAVTQATLRSALLNLPGAECLLGGKTREVGLFGVPREISGVWSPESSGRDSSSRIFPPRAFLKSSGDAVPNRLARTLWSPSAAFCSSWQELGTRRQTTLSMLKGFSSAGLRTLSGTCASERSMSHCLSRLTLSGAG